MTIPDQFSNNTLDNNQQMKVSEKNSKSSWSDKYAKSLHADKWLAFFAFTEASFFPLPPSTLMVAIMSTDNKHKKWLYYAALTTITSVLGGLFGYLIGGIFYDTLGQGIISAYDLSGQIQKVNSMFQNNAFLAIFVAAFTPIPYKVFTIAAGFFEVNIFTFIVASLLGRGIRYFGIAYIVSILGDRIGKKAMNYLNYFALTVALIIIIYFFYKLLSFVF